MIFVETRQPVSIFHGNVNGMSFVLLWVGENECEHIVYFVKFSLLSLYSLIYFRSLMRCACLLFRTNHSVHYSDPPPPYGVLFQSVAVSTTWRQSGRPEAFLHTEERPMFRGLRSASTECNQG